MHTFVDVEYCLFTNVLSGDTGRRSWWCLYMHLVGARLRLDRTCRAWWLPADDFLQCVCTTHAMACEHKAGSVLGASFLHSEWRGRRLAIPRCVCATVYDPVPLIVLAAFSTWRPAHKAGDAAPHMSTRSLVPALCRSPPQSFRISAPASPTG